MSSNNVGDFYIHPILTPSYEFAFRLLLERFNKTREYEELRNYVIKQQPHVPQLYIYSDADDLVPSQDIKEFIELNKQILNGRVKIEELEFHDSKHVAHFKTHPRQYTQRVLSFIRECVDLHRVVLNSG